MTSTLVRGRWVIIDDGDGPRALSDAAVRIDDDRIAKIGPFADLRASHPDTPVLGSERYAVMPGLINAHHHANAISHLQHGIADDLLEPWLLGNTVIRPTDPGARTSLAAARLLKTGVTAVVDMASVPGATDAGHAELTARLDAYEASGLRGVLCPGVSFESRLIHREDQAFLASLPADLAARATAAFLDRDAGTPDDYLAIVKGLIERASSMTRASVAYGPPGPQWVGDDLMVRIAEAAERFDVGIQTHAMESYYERLESPRAYGMSLFERYRELGVLSPRLSFAHAVWASEADIAVLAETGAAVSHNPSSNLRLRSGVMPLNGMTAAGVTVGLGMDGTTVGDDEDMFAEMRLAARLHREPRLGAPAPSPADILRLATTGGARLMRRNDIGRLAPGMKAGMVLVDLERLSWPWIAPEVDPLALVLLKAKAGDVTTVLVDGEVVLRDGRPTRIDMQEIAETLVDGLERQALPDEMAELVMALKPHLVAWYQAWPAGEDVPWAAFNSRR